MVVLSPERNKPFKCKTVLPFCPPNWEFLELTGVYLYHLSQRHLTLKIVRLN